MELLSKLYYQDQEKYLAEYERRFNSPQTIKLNFFIGKYPAFFVETNEISNLSRQILRLDKEIFRVVKELPPIALEQFTQRCLIDEIILTNKIEGVYSTRREINLVLKDLESQSKGSKKRFQGLVNKYFKLNEENISLSTCQDIRDLYDEIVGEEIKAENPANLPEGQFFRKESVSVYSETEKEIHQGLYPESRIIQAMEQALVFLQDENIEILYRTALFHYLLEYIHPFYDGNGRLGRFILSYLLGKELEPPLAYRLSYTIKDNIAKYYQAFKIGNNPHNRGELTYFLLFMLTLFRNSLVQLFQALTERFIELTRYSSLLIKIPEMRKERTNKVYGLLLQASLFAEPGISRRELENYLNISYSTLKKELDLIKEKNLLIINRAGRELYYKLNLDNLR